MSQPLRRSRGFRQISSLAATPIRHAAEGRGFAVVRLLTNWVEVVGTEIAARARPVKVRQGRRELGATLTLLTTGAAAPLLEMQIPQIRERVNACYGYNAISRIVLTQTAPVGFTDGQARFNSVPAASSVQASNSDILDAAKVMAADISDSKLQAALMRFATLRLTREGSINRKANA